MEKEFFIANENGKLKFFTEKPWYNVFEHTYRPIEGTYCIEKELRIPEGYCLRVVVGATFVGTEIVDFNK